MKSQLYNTYDCSHINLTRVPKGRACFCVFIDIGAPRSVIGRPQLNVILQKLGKKPIPHIVSHNSFRIGDVTVKSLGMVEIVLDTPSNDPNVLVLKDIVPIDVPALFGLDVLDSERLYADDVTNRLVHREVLSRPGEQLRYKDRWHLPLARYDNHLYARMKFLPWTFYAAAQLHRMHRQFAHTFAEKLYKLLKCAGLQAVDASTLSLLEEISAKFEPCQRIKNALLHFRVSMRHENVQFNAKGYI